MHFIGREFETTPEGWAHLGWLVYHNGDNVEGSVVDGVTMHVDAVLDSDVPSNAASLPFRIVNTRNTGDFGTPDYLTLGGRLAFLVPEEGTAVASVIGRVETRRDGTAAISERGDPETATIDSIDFGDVEEGMGAVAYVAECGAAQTVLSVDGTSQLEDAKETVACEWTSANCTFEDPSLCETKAMCPRGANVATLTRLAAGESSTSGVLLLVEDSTAPSVECPPDVVGASEWDLLPETTGYPAVSEMCSEPTVSFANTKKTNNNGCGCEVRRRWTAADLDGNSASCEQVLAVSDETAPYLDGQDVRRLTTGGGAPILASDWRIVSWLNTLHAVEGCSSLTTYVDVPLEFLPGTTTFVPFRAVDGCGNESTYELQVDVCSVPDVDRNGSSEVLWRHEATGETGAWLLDGLTYTGWCTLGVEPGQDWQVMGVGDFNRDFSTDVLWRNAKDGRVGAWTTKGSCEISGWLPIGVEPSSSWHIVGASDFNGDLRSDVLWWNESSGLVGAWLTSETGVGSWCSMLVEPPTSGWRIQGVGDFDGDLDSDLLWRNTRTGDVGALFLTGCTTERFAFLPTEPPESGWNIVAVADYSGDCGADVVWRNKLTGDVGAWILDQTRVDHWQPLGTEPPNSGWEIQGPK